MARTRAQEAARAITITREYAPDREAMVEALLVVLRGPGKRPTVADPTPVDDAGAEAER